jgi:hypothetical protein
MLRFLSALLEILRRMDSDRARSEHPTETAAADNDRSARLSAYMEVYSIAANRYENVYLSMWTIFSYMSAITAALFTFGAAGLYIEPLLAVSLIPLLFWYMTTYFPLDRYGNKSVDDLQRLEKLLAEEFRIRAEQFTTFNELRQNWRWDRARCWLVPVFWIVLVAWLYGIATTGSKIYRGHRLGPPEKPEVILKLPS